MGPDLGDNELEKGIHNLGAQQHQHPCDRSSSQEWLPLICFQGCYSCAPPIPRRLQDQLAGSFQVSAFALGPRECEIVCPLRVTEKEMATHSSILAWRIPWTEKPGGLQSSMGCKVRHD